MFPTHRPCHSIGRFRLYKGLKPLKPWGRIKFSFLVPITYFGCGNEKVCYVWPFFHHNNHSQRSKGSNSSLYLSKSEYPVKTYWSTFLYKISVTLKVTSKESEDSMRHFESKAHLFSQLESHKMITRLKWLKASFPLGTDRPSEGCVSLATELWGCTLIWRQERDEVSLVHLLLTQQVSLYQFCHSSTNQLCYQKARQTGYKDMIKTFYVYFVLWRVPLERLEGELSFVLYENFSRCQDLPA